MRLTYTNLRRFTSRVVVCIVQFTAVAALAGPIGSGLPASTARAAAASITLSKPNTAVNWGVGSTQQIRWTHNLGSDSSVRIELSRDGGVSYSLLATVPNKVLMGSFDWVVTGPATHAALIRVRWTGGAVSDTSDQRFTIAAPFVAVTTPGAGDTWSSGTPASIRWSSNLGVKDRVDVRLSKDNGATYPIVLAAKTSADGRHRVTVDPAWATANARVRVVWVKDSRTASASNAFRVESSSPPGDVRRVVFTPSVDHDVSVDSYVLEVFPAFADSRTALPLATQDLGKPPVIDGECVVDITETYERLPSGSYVATVAAIGSGGTSRSEPFSFSR